MTMAQVLVILFILMLGLSPVLSDAIRWLAGLFKSKPGYLVLEETSDESPLSRSQVTRFCENIAQKLEEELRELGASIAAAQAEFTDQPDLPPKRRHELTVELLELTDLVSLREYQHQAIRCLAETGQSSQMTCSDSEAAVKLHKAALAVMDLPVEAWSSQPTSTPP